MYQLVSLRRVLLWVLPAVAVLASALVRWVATPSVPTAADPDEGVAVPIVMYHSLLPEGSSDYIITPTLFEQDLQYLQQNGYTAVTVADLIAYVDEGTPLPDHPVMLTFDDGYYNNYLYAHPLLQSYGMRAVLSPIGSVSAFYSDNPAEQDRPRYSHVTWAQMREMTASGVWEIQNHSDNLHHNQKNERKGAAKMRGESDTAYRQMLTADLTAAQERLTTQVGVTPTAFTYPFGAYSTASQPILEELGFRASLSCEEKVSRITRSPHSLWRLGRYRRPPGIDSRTFFEMIFQQAEDE